MNRTIVMADVIGSSKQDSKQLMKDFKAVVEGVNGRNENSLISPLTITLGDEFQGIARNAHSAIEVILALEDAIMDLAKPFRLRYIIHEGPIDTPINKEKAYEMLGAGLTDARERLIALKSTKRRFEVSFLNKELNERVNLMFTIYQGIADRWTAGQRKVVNAFRELDDYKKVAEKLKKDPSVIWRRKRALMIEEYNSVKELILKAA
jgi:SatD family (SatD)